MMKTNLTVPAAFIGLALLTSQAKADLVQIDDLSETGLAASLVHDRPGQQGTISNIEFFGTEMVSFTYTLAPGEFWLNNLRFYRQVFDLDGLTVSDIWRMTTTATTGNALIEFASDPSTLSTSGFTSLGNVVETGNFQDMFVSSGVDVVHFQVRSEAPEPSALVLAVIALLGAGALRRETAA